MASTAIPFVKTSILEALESAEGLEEVVVSGDREPEQALEYIWLYKAKAKREFRLVRPRPAPLEEEVRIFLRVLAVRAEAMDAENRALEIAEAVENALRALDLGPPVLFPLLIEELDDEQLQFDQKRGCHVLMTVATKARI
jgi:hypothetical protein